MTQRLRAETKLNGALDLVKAFNLEQVRQRDNTAASKAIKTLLKSGNVGFLDKNNERFNGKQSKKALNFLRHCSMRTHLGHIARKYVRNPWKQEHRLICDNERNRQFRDAIMMFEESKKSLEEEHILAFEAGELFAELGFNEKAITCFEAASTRIDYTIDMMLVEKDPVERGIEARKLEKMAKEKRKQYLHDLRLLSERKLKNAYEMQRVLLLLSYVHLFRLNIIIRKHTNAQQYAQITFDPFFDGGERSVNESFDFTASLDSLSHDALFYNKIEQFELMAFCHYTCVDETAAVESQWTGAEKIINCSGGSVTEAHISVMVELLQYLETRLDESGTTSRQSRADARAFNHPNYHLLRVDVLYWLGHRYAQSYRITEGNACYLLAEEAKYDAKFPRVCDIEDERLTTDSEIFIAPRHQHKTIDINTLSVRTPGSIAFRRSLRSGLDTGDGTRSGTESKIPKDNYGKRFMARYGHQAGGDDISKPPIREHRDFTLFQKPHDSACTILYVPPNRGWQADVQAQEESANLVKRTQRMSMAGKEVGVGGRRGSVLSLGELNSNYTSLHRATGNDLTDDLNYGHPFKYTSDDTLRAAENITNFEGTVLERELPPEVFDRSLSTRLAGKVRPRRPTPKDTRFTNSMTSMSKDTTLNFPKLPPKFQFS